MKVIGIAGSPRKNSNSTRLVKEVLAGAAEVGAQTGLLILNEKQIKGCQACMYCRSHEGCAVKDEMQEIYKEIASADKVVIGTPIYMYQVTAQTKSFIDRLYPYMNDDFSAKVNKETVLVVTQGTPEPKAFNAYLDQTAGALKLLGFPVVDTLVEGGLYMPGDIEKREAVLANARLVGKKLAKA